MTVYEHECMDNQLPINLKSTLVRSSKNYVLCNGIGHIVDRVCCSKIYSYLRSWNKNIYKLLISTISSDAVYKNNAHTHKKLLKVTQTLICTLQAVPKKDVT